MASFGKFIKTERERKGWSQTEFGALIKINTPLVSRIENDKKSLALDKVKLLAEIFEIDYEKVKDLFFADKFAKDAYKYKCSESVFSAAEAQTKYLKEINITQGKLTF
ncbi:helix-turn-helix domain-containing protein [Flavobacterium muglaense]|jgi:transcriptional regulator with XRE-family HTH domain|uniref:Helix-turn-helix transcriptional regulator n=1 Tax=Flavobacterium muglaense TaxID=2764716 RepID=A0A923MZQ6_9FLAO|nr:helix-turn-helix transcriptional regulator [Flavobacterium muglaense]MBC5837845.1 helix-turn-helix transcriptional regulator [Flavobacterium muglaense]MBC5844397.1 helix-turn-helix transcriptional regulator [Flavobacterium muglaense]